MAISTKQRTTLSLLRQLTSLEDWTCESVDYTTGYFPNDIDFTQYYLHQTSTHNLYTFSNPFKCIGKFKNTKAIGEYAEFHRKHNMEMREQYTKYKIIHNNQLKIVLEEMEVSKFNPRSVMGKLDFDRRAEEDGIVWEEADTTNEYEERRKGDLPENITVDYDTARNKKFYHNTDTKQSRYYLNQFVLPENIMVGYDPVIECKYYYDKDTKKFSFEDMGE